VKFWDASAIMPLLVAETTTERLQALAQLDGSGVKAQLRPPGDSLLE